MPTPSLSEIETINTESNVIPTVSVVSSTTPRRIIKYSQLLNMFYPNKQYTNLNLTELGSFNKKVFNYQETYPMYEYINDLQ